MAKLQGIAAQRHQCPARRRMAAEVIDQGIRRNRFDQAGDLST
jgi:hypothetical protein